MAVLASVLGQVGTAQMYASWRVHGVLIAPGLVLSGLSLYRARLHWPVVNIATPARNVRNVGWYILLFAIGTLLGVFISVGSALILGVAAPLLYLCPWMKIPVCRSKFVVSSLMLLDGAIASIVVFGRSIQSLYLMMFAWMLYLPPVFMHILLLLALDRRYRIGGSHLTDGSNPHAHVHPSPVQERVASDGGIQ